MDSPINWGDIATWFTGLITFFLLLLGAIELIHERKLRKKYEAEKELQAICAQAEKVSCWIAGEHDALCIAIANQSQLPVYQVIVTVVVVDQEGELRHSGSGDQACNAVVPPGIGYTNVISDYHGMHRRPGVEIAFRDAAGRNWIRKVDGNLTRIDKSTLAYYEINLPTDWRFLKDTKPITGNIG